MASYTLEKELGKGAFGSVWKGVDTKTGRSVAIKIVTVPTKTLSIDREHYIPLLLQTGGCHKNISCLLDYYESEGKYMYVTEYITGGELVHKNYPKDNLGKLDIAYQLADGLDYMHQRDIAHRDIKPANILLRGPVPVYIDFGLACIDLPSTAPEKECQGIYGRYRCGDARAGSPNFMAPEMIIGQAGDNILKSDIYSLGILFYKLFNNDKLPYKKNLPYKRNLPPAEIYQNLIATSQVKKDLKSSASGIPELDKLIDRMLSAKPEDRPTAAEIRAELSRIIKQ